MSLHVKIEICQADILNLLASDWKSPPPPNTTGIELAKLTVSKRAIWQIDWQSILKQEHPKNFHNNLLMFSLREGKGRNLLTLQSFIQNTSYSTYPKPYFNTPIYKIRSLSLCGILLLLNN